MDDIDVDGNFLIDLSSHIESQIFWNGAYVFAERMLLERIVGAEDVIVDVGANVGEFTVFAARRATRGRVLAFEPVVELNERLTKNVELNSLTNVIVVRMGLYDHLCSMDIYISDGLDARNSVNQGMNNLYASPPGSQGFVEKIELTTLDAWWQQRGLTRLDLIKLDIEGAEFFALQGVRNLLASFHPRLIVEVEQSHLARAGVELEQTFEYLRSFGYTLFNLRENGELEEIVQGDGRLGRNIYCVA